MLVFEKAVEPSTVMFGRRQEASGSAQVFQGTYYYDSGPRAHAPRRGFFRVGHTFSL